MGGEEGVDKSSGFKSKQKRMKTEQKSANSVEGGKLDPSTEIQSPEAVIKAQKAIIKAQKERRGTFVVAAKYPKDAFEDESGDDATNPKGCNEVSEKVPNVEVVEDPTRAVEAVEKGASSSQGKSSIAPGAQLSVVETLQERADAEDSDFIDVADKVESHGDESVEAPGKAEGAGDFVCNNVTSDSDDTEVSHFLPNRKAAKVGALGSLLEEPLVKSKKVDVREVVRGHTFTICLCKAEEEGECDCEGLMEVNKELGGSISNAYMDPLSDYESDFSPELSFGKTTGWKKSEPNVIKFKLGGVEACGIKSSKGEVVLTADEVLNEDGNPRVVIRANMNLQLGVNNLYTKRGFKNPLKFKSIECNLLERVNADGGRRRENRGSQTEEDEDV